MNRLVAETRCHELHTLISTWKWSLHIKEERQPWVPAYALSSQDIGVSGTIHSNRIKSRDYANTTATIEKDTTLDLYLSASCFCLLFLLVSRSLIEFVGFMMGTFLAVSK